ncbi:HPP family protein [Biscogniauxia mediterranea]|nr:HPP family protein [Biscogniauxia mediterranea]
MQSSSSSSSSPIPWNFDIDKYLNRFIPQPSWRSIPYPLAYFMGYRRGDPKVRGNLLVTLWAFVGVFCSLVLIQVISDQIPDVADHGLSIIASFGAAAVLQFYAIESPFSQPRNCFFSQIMASIVGVSCCKLFSLSPNFESIRWLGGALACAFTVALMGLTKTIHPPAGATALIAVIDDGITRVGWFLVPLVILHCSIMLGVALVLNNIQRRYPIYWWTSDDLQGSQAQKNDDIPPIEEKVTSQHREVVVTGNQITIPDGVMLSEEEKIVLQRICGKL